MAPRSRCAKSLHSFATVTGTCWRLATHALARCLVRWAYTTPRICEFHTRKLTRRSMSLARSAQHDLEHHTMLEQRHCRVELYFDLDLDRQHQSKPVRAHGAAPLPPEYRIANINVPLSLSLSRSLSLSLSLSLTPLISYRLHEWQAAIRWQLPNRPADIQGL